MSLTRREILVGLSATGLLSCRCPSSVDPRPLLDATPEDLPRALASLGRTDVGALTAALAELALRRCSPRTHALLGVWPALHLSEYVDRPRLLAPLIHAALAIRRQTSAEPFQLPDLPPSAAPADVQLLQQALGQDDLDGAEAQLAGLLDRDDRLSAQLVVTWYSCREYGQGGHNVSLACAARRLMSAGSTPEMLRAPIHSMVAHRRADAVVRPTRMTRAPRADPSMTLTAAAAQALESADLTGPWPEELHLYLAADAVADLSTWIAGQGRDAQARMMRARALDWLDAWWRGKSAYPRPNPRSAVSAVDLPEDTRAALDWLVDAAAAGSTSDVGAGLAAWGGRPLPPLRELLAEAALAASARTDGHASQLAAVALRAASPAELALCGPMLVLAATEGEADYEAIAAALDTPSDLFH